eukprot:9700194-Lingulodinium_polyedra.AAC.1
MERANVRFASRCANETLAQPRHCATSAKRCAMMRSNRRFAGATARKLHARALHARVNTAARVERAS